ncbi:UDP-N-acetylmuramoyl-L-alanine--D-glutamate ligase [Desulfotruncus alcoholivorax]|uniref:UDP-N-acetylmuramoyl-L-alanine--D-glutamate ligase n=1 Tax=Desulfotruncus alcoholivorax TaxID=265477 RepID=UPI0004266EA3|nr:UDP-N-acetylmuramoyl-L-alanine--D-glutamate ligase [Desulfotruncus alcoholivorax]
MNLKGKKILVVGAGKSGISVTRFLMQKEAIVTLTDNRDRDQFNGELDDLLVSGVRAALGNYPDVAPGLFDLVVVSPGVPLTVAPVVSARERGVPVTGELELAWRFARTPFIAITGTNGKTTTTALVGEIFKAAGYKTLVGGNIGVPLVDVVEDYGPEDIIVAEVSSFQLETVELFRPRVAIITNITPDHLDRHGTMEAYTAAKARIFARQEAGDYTVLNYDDPKTRALAGITGGKVIFFSRRHILEEGVFVREGNMLLRLGGIDQEIMPVKDIAIPGGHNLENALAAAAAAAVLGASPELLELTLKTFPGVAHRLETVAEINGVKYVNDSKGTNPEASIKALEAFDSPIVLLAGGRNKGSDFTEFARLAGKKARVMVILGECAAEIEQAARQAGISSILKAASFNEAVLMAHGAAKPGDVVLLSPACASWDMFKNYEERGELFRQIVSGLK